MSDPLYTCPRCQRTGYSARGLTAHVCNGITSFDALGQNRRRLSKSEIAIAIAITKFRGPTLVGLRNGLQALVESMGHPAPLTLRGSHPAAKMGLSWTNDGRYLPTGKPHALDIVAVQLAVAGTMVPVFGRKEEVVS